MFSIRVIRSGTGVPGKRSGFVFSAMFFLTGVLFGYLWAVRLSDAVLQEIFLYLTAFATLDARSSYPLQSLLSLIILYVRYPALGFFLGFTSIGVFLLPVVCTAFGFTLSFSVCALTAALGKKGVVLALLLFGLRCFVTVPCFFLLTSASWRSSRELFSVSFGTGRRPQVKVAAKEIVFGVMTALAIGVCVDFWLSPLLLQSVFYKLML